MICTSVDDVFEERNDSGDVRKAWLVTDWFLSLSNIHQIANLFARSLQFFRDYSGVDNYLIRGATLNVAGAP